MSLPDLRLLVRFDEQLREAPLDREAVENALSAATRALDAHPDDVKLLVYAGNAARILGRADESIALFERALAAAEGERASAARIGLGEAYRCADRPAEAVAQLEAALSEARHTGAHLDFALQHLGKAVLDAGDQARAAALLEEALELRRHKGDAALIESSERALALSRRREI
jgi:tetratricopeptide (TPR) repeat protein